MLSRPYNTCVIIVTQILLNEHHFSKPKPKSTFSNVIVKFSRVSMVYRVALAGINLVYISTQKANTVQAVHLTEQKNNIVSVTVPGPADSLSAVTSQADLFYVRVTSQGVGTSHLISIQKEAPNRLPSINLVKEGVDSHLRAVYQSSPEQSLIIKLQSIKVSRPLKCDFYFIHSGY